MRSQLAEILNAQCELWSVWFDDRTQTQHATESSRLKVFSDFLETNPNAADRHNLPGHLTGSAMVVDPSLNHVLLTHHRKLNLWLQLGGHADGEWDLGSVALREVNEESGLTQLSTLQYRLHGKTKFLPFDLDCHDIPANSKDPRHQHFDVRYVVVADRSANVTISDESHDVRWFTIEDARNFTSELSMHRQFDKVQFLRAHPKLWVLVEV